MQMAIDAIDLVCNALNRRFKSQEMEFEQFMSLLYNVKDVLDGDNPKEFSVDGIPLSESEIKAVTAFVRMMRERD
jgi:hypothetical protein